MWRNGWKRRGRSKTGVTWRARMKQTQVIIVSCCRRLFFLANHLFLEALCLLASRSSCRKQKTVWRKKQRPKVRKRSKRKRKKAPLAPGLRNLMVRNLRYCNSKILYSSLSIGCYQLNFATPRFIFSIQRRIKKAKPRI